MNRQVKTWRPPTDVFETDDEIIVRMEIAGVDEGSFDIELVKRTLVVTGQRSDQSCGTKRAYQQMEISYGDFRTEVYLPWPVDESGVEANYRDGFLEISMPKAKVMRVPVGKPAVSAESDSAH